MLLKLGILVWLIDGILILTGPDIGKIQYFLTWFTLMVTALIKVER